MKPHVRRRARPKRAATTYEALQEFIEYMRDERRASPLTLDAYERDLLRFAAHTEELGANALAEIDSEIVREHMRALTARRLSRATIRRALYAMASFFRWAVRWEHVRLSSMGRITIPPRERVREVRALSKRERAVMISAADGLAAHSTRSVDGLAPLLVRLMLKTGLRRQEVLNLDWRDVDLERGTIAVRHGKGDKSRLLPLEDADVIARLEQLRRDRGIAEPEETAAVFTGKAGRRLKRTSFYRVFARVLAAAELKGKGITPHALRHTFGTVLCDRGVPLPYVRDLLGHSDIASTMVYVHTTPAALRAAVRRLRE